MLMQFLNNLIRFSLKLFLKIRYATFKNIFALFFCLNWDCAAASKGDVSKLSGSRQFEVSTDLILSTI